MIVIKLDSRSTRGNKIFGINDMGRREENFQRIKN